MAVNVAVKIVEGRRIRMDATCKHKTKHDFVGAELAALMAELPWAPEGEATNAVECLDVCHKLGVRFTAVDGRPKIARFESRAVAMEGDEPDIVSARQYGQSIEFSIG